MLPFGVTIPATVPQRLEIPEGLMNYPVHNASPYYFPFYEQRVDLSNYRSNSMPVFTDSLEGVVRKFICLRQVIEGGICLLEAVFSAF
jgi:hypothetical protein